MPKTGFILLSVFFIILTSCASAPAQTGQEQSALPQPPFNRGVNLTGIFSSDSAQQILFTPGIKDDFKNIRALGCDVVRLPVNLHAMTSGAPDYKIDPLFFALLDSTLEWAAQYNLQIILDNHSFDPAVPTSPAIEELLIKIWPQMAEYYKNRFEHVHFEILNEPHGIDHRTWGRIQGSVVAAIREKDPERSIIVGGADWNSYNALYHLPEYPQDNLIYTFHFYDPMLFTHQGATWTNPSMADISGIPFPAKAAALPRLPAAARGTWLASAFQSYPTEGTARHIQNRLEIAARFSRERNVPIFCGEFGVYNLYSDPSHRLEWYRVVVDELDRLGISWTSWDYRGGFGIHKPKSSERFEHDLDIELITAMGFNVPEQTTPKGRVALDEIILYDGYMGRDIQENSWVPAGVISYFASDLESTGDYCIKWTRAERYQAIRWRFRQEQDLRELKNRGYVLEFRIKWTTPDIRFDIRLLNPDKDTDQIPWRMGITVSEALAAKDNQWHTIRIPLKNLEDKGAWKDQWFNPQGAFNWSRIESLQIVPEHQDLGDAVIYLDSIRITAP